MQIKDLRFKNLVQLFYSRLGSLGAWELVSLGAVIVTVESWAKAVLIPLGSCSSR